MKICDLTQSYSETSGGIKTYIQEKQKYIKNFTGHQHVLIIPGKYDTVKSDKNLKTYFVSGIPIPGLKPYRFIIRLDKVRSILKIEKPDLIELGCVYTLPYSAFLYKKKNRCILSGFYHTDFPDAYVERPLCEILKPAVAKKAREYAESYARYIYNNCDVTITASTLMYEKLKNMGINNIHKIFLGVDTKLFNPGKRDKDFRKSLAVKDNEILLIYTGRLDNEKRTNVILEAFDRISENFNGKLLLIGDGPFKDIVLKFSKKNKKVVFFPYENDREKLAVMLASADIYITAGPSETFGLSIIEAQACGLPVLGVSGGALVERVNDKVGMLSPVDSVKGMADNIVQLSANGYLEKGKNARMLVEAEYSWNNTFDKLVTLYENISKDKQYAVNF